MEIEVYWTDFARNELKSIFDYHIENANLNAAIKIVTQLVKKADRLCNFPEIGATEELLKDRHQQFRYIVSTNYKIIYWVNKAKKRVEIVDVFDTRQNPTKINKEQISHLPRCACKIFQ